MLRIWLIDQKCDLDACAAAGEMAAAHLEPGNEDWIFFYVAAWDEKAEELGYRYLLDDDAHPDGYSFAEAAAIGYRCRCPRGDQHVHQQGCGWWRFLT